MVTNAVSITGDSVNLENYAIILKKYYGIESLIAYNASDANNSSLRIREIQSHGISVEAVFKESDLFSISKNFQATHGYFVADGHFFPRWIPGVKHLNHAVFRFFEPYGDKYAYVSEWLYEYANRKKITRTELELKKIYATCDSPYRVDKEMQTGWVPHTVMPKFESGHEFRKKHSISKDVFLVGRIGGFKKFSDPEAKKAVCEILESYKDIVFCFINTEKFINHKNAVFLGEINELEKWQFYDACNLLLNCRISGESFGFSIVEPLMINKPVLAPSILRNRLMDQNQISILKYQGLLYHSRMHLKYLISKYKKDHYSSKVVNSQRFSKLVEQYNSKNVAEKFVEYFLDSQVPKLSLWSES
jgi:hypothetical protein